MTQELNDALAALTLARAALEKVGKFIEVQEQQVYDRGDWLTIIGSDGNFHTGFITAVAAQSCSIVFLDGKHWRGTYKLKLPLSKEDVNTMVGENIWRRATREEINRQLSLAMGGD